MSAQVQITFFVSAAQRDNLDRMAKVANVSRAAYAALLFNAAYSARCKAVGDLDLDAAVSRIVLLHGTKDFDTAAIAGVVGLKEATIAKILGAWRKEMRGGRA